MRNQFFNLAMLVALLFTSSVTSMMAQNPSEWTKLSTNTIKGLKCDHYLEGYRTFRLDNGDFFSFKESEYGVDDPTSYGEYLVGDFKITESTGNIVEGKGNVVSRIYNTGYVLSGKLKPNRSFAYWQTIGNVISSTHTFSFDSCDEITLTSPDGKNVYLRATNLREYMPTRYMDIFTSVTELFMDDTKTHLYCITKSGMFFECAKIVNNYICFCRPEEEIASVEEINYYAYKINYQNGDTLRCDCDGKKFSGILNRKDGKLTLKVVNNKQSIIMELPDGTKIAGNSDLFMCEKPKCIPDGDLYQGLNWFCHETLALPELSIWNGYLIKPDGTSIRYIKGKTETEIQAEKEYAQKAATAKVTAERQALEKKYGKQFVDGLCLFPRPKIYVGCPLALLNEVYYVIEELSNQSVTQYEVGTKSDKKSWITGARFRVWVNNATKKVTAVQTL